MTLFLRLIRTPFRKFVELFTIGFCIVFIGYLTYWAFDFVYFSHKFGDISPGLLAIPFWIPRLAMALGSFIFLTALIDEFVSVVLGAKPSYEANASPVYEASTEQQQIVED